MHIKYLTSYIRRSPEKLKLAVRCVVAPYFKWVPPGHFYSPLPDMNEISRRALQIWPPAPPSELPGLDLRPQQQEALLAAFRPYCSELPFERSQNPESRFYRPNGSFGFQDAFILHAMIRHLRPKRIIEVGCGSSSAAILDTCEAFSRDTSLTFIEPYPEWLLRMTRPEDSKRYELRKEFIQSVPLELFANLERNDVLFIDTSHVTKVGSDVNHVLFQILPVLKPGVYVHFHDIWYPFEYPLDWLQKGMFWSEAYLLRAFLMYNQRFEIRIFNSYLTHCMGEKLRQSFPLFLQEPGASIWLQRTDNEG